ncbi:cupin domain-containing protein [Parvularcula sp. ZS-1/3]|uniref:Cupin domain-containing protein n=1 Tax=Parvularcula mediterranea TaxID=2732508 RepID=A0A7Y3W6M6_9PROT|nr:cupin domain-containing protein [Parvularcula mediterranea]NNU17512.1 cupin domain-containing protein [Parvularcula mediterranea]
MSALNLLSAAELCPDTWSPMVVADVNATSVKVARVEGNFVWHHHEEEDEAFLVLRGELKICYRDREAVVLKSGDLHVVPRGVEHCPQAEEECFIVLIEQSSTAHTGEVESTLTRSAEEQRDAAEVVLGQ